MTDKRCGNCEHWNVLGGDHGRCVPPLPMWLAEMLSDKAQKHETRSYEGRDCAQFDEYQEEEP